MGREWWCGRQRPSDLQRSTLGAELRVVDAAVLPLISEGLAVDAFASWALAGSDFEAGKDVALESRCTSQQAVQEISSCW